MSGHCWRVVLIAVAVNLGVTVANAQFAPPPVESGPITAPRLLPGVPGAAPIRTGYVDQASYVQPASDMSEMAPGAPGDGPPGNAAPAEYGSSAGCATCQAGQCDSGACDNGPCDGCPNCHCCGDPCLFPCGWYVGAEAVWARPYFQHNFAYATEVSTTNQQGNNNYAFTETAFHYDFDITPRIWVGYENECGFGIRARYWEFDQQSDEITLQDPVISNVIIPINLNGLRGSVGFINDGSGFGFIAGQPGDVLTIQSSLEMHVVDIEATQRFKWCCTDAQAGFGIRIARIDQAYDAEMYRNSDNFNDDDFLRHSTKFVGAGPTAALDLRRPVCCGGWSVFGGARGAVLFGKTDESYSYEVLTSDDPTFEDGQLNRSEYEVRAVGEFQLGLEWRHCLECGAELFAQASVEGQFWEGVGNSFDRSGDLGLLGFGIAAGFQR